MLGRVWSLLLALIASSLTMTSTVHAREIPGWSTVDCSGIVHSDGDADQSQGDLDTAAPHHHGNCHGQALDVPAPNAPLAVTSISSMRPVAAPLAAIPSRAVDPGLRPPSA